MQSPRPYVLDMFQTPLYRPPMPETPPLRPASPEEITDTLAFALRYEGRKHVHHADDMMARITADRLARHLERSGFVVMKAPARPAHSSTAHLPDPDGKA